MTRPPKSLPSTAPLESGFSLIELMVVIAIISILAGLLLPALSSAMQKAKRIACVNNMRQIGIAARGSANDKEGKLPIGGGDSTNAIWITNRYVHFGRLIPGELDDVAKVFYCPSADLFNTGFSNGLRRVGVQGQVAYSSYFQRGSRQQAPGSDTASSSRVLLSDYETKYPAGWGDWIARNHKTGKNTLRVDGSVSFVRGEDDSEWVDHGGDSKPGAKDGTWGKLDRDGK